MEQQSRAGVTPAKWDQWEGKPGGGHVFMAVLLLIAAGVLAAIGFYVALTYDDGSRLVGGMHSTSKSSLAEDLFG